MKKSFLLLVVLGMTACMAGGQGRFSIRDQETIKRTLEFSTGSGTNLLEVDGVNGSIHVTGYDGRNVEMVANKTIRAESQDKVETAKREVKLDITDKSDTVRIYVDQPGHEHSTTSSSHSNWSYDGYEVSFDFEIRVPRQAAIHLWTVNGGDIDVQNIAGDFDVRHVNGSVELQGLSGSGRAHTVNGHVKAGFVNNPKGDSSFGSINGAIEVTFQKNLSANLRYKTMNGGVYTDFPVTTLAALPGVAERRNGMFVYRSEFSGARIGNGGPELTFENLNGNIQILQAK